eukprot:gene46390-62045_t
MEVPVAELHAKAQQAAQAYRASALDAIAQRGRDMADGVWFVLVFVQGPCALAMFLLGLVQVRSGAVWLTWPGCQDDVFLSAGQAASLPASARALVQVEPRLAKGAAVLRLVVADRTGHELQVPLSKVRQAHSGARPVQAFNALRCAEVAATSSGCPGIQWHRLAHP